MFGARQCHVKEAFFLQDQPPLLCFRRPFRNNQAKAPRHEDDRELESLRHVHGHDLHAVSFGLLVAQGPVLTGALVLLAPGPQRLRELANRLRPTPELMQKRVEDLPRGRPAAIKVGVIRTRMRKQRIVHHVFEELTPRLPGDQLLPDVHEARELPVIVRQTIRQLVGTASEKRRQQQRLQASAPTGTRQEIKKCEQRLGFGRGIETLLLVDRERNIRLGQDFPRRLRVGMAAHENTHVAVREAV